MKCQICSLYYTNPQVVIDCGHVYCQACLAEIIGGKDKDDQTCPGCQKPIKEIKDLEMFTSLNQQLRDALTSIKDTEEKIADPEYDFMTPSKETKASLTATLGEKDQEIERLNQILIQSNL